MFYVFASERFYPGGGMNDLVGEYKTLDDARTFVQSALGYGKEYDWAQIVTVENGKLITVETY